MVSTDPSTITTALRRVLQPGIYVERSSADYPGGLGNVAGDQLKAASDLGVPVVGCRTALPARLFPTGHRQGRKAQALFPYNDPGQLPITPLRTERRVVAVGDHAARFLGLVARLAGSGRQSQTLPAGQQ